MSIEQCYNLEDFRQLARRRLPAPLFHFMDGGADDETALRGSVSAFEQCQLMPNALSDASNFDFSTTVLGQKIDWPVILSPTGINRLFHHDGERAVARAAAKAGTIYSLSTMSNVSIEEIGALTSGPKCFQVYIHRDRGLTREFIQRCKDANYDSLTLTVDLPRAGNRERELRYGFSMPPKLNLAGMAGFAARPGWVYRALTHPKSILANVAHKIPEGSSQSTSLIEYVASQFDPSVTWDDLGWMISEWAGPFAIKGILSAADARKAVDSGVSAIIVSNHGGRQLDGALSAFEALGPIVDEVGGECEIICDGGIRRGTHVLKALARGATACSMGRPYLFGLAAAGQPGVTRVLDLLRAEIERDMALIGCRNIAEISRKHIYP